MLMLKALVYSPIIIVHYKLSLLTFNVIITLYCIVLTATTNIIAAHLTTIINRGLKVWMKDKQLVQKMNGQLVILLKD